MAKKFTVEYTFKELMKKLDHIDNKLSVTTEKVMLHEKILYALGTAILSIIGWMILVN